jgi:CRP-like cAMP-binding protein
MVSMPAFHSDNFNFKTTEIFDGLSAEEVRVLEGASVTHNYKKKEILFREGGIPAGIFHLKSGKVKKYKTTQKGAEQIFYICSSGELLGYHALLSEEYYPDSAATMQDCQISFIPKDVFLSVLLGSPLLANKLLKILAHEFSVFTNSITSLATKTVRERLALNLLILNEKFREGGHDPANINMSRTDMANLVGTAKETLVRLLQDFKKENLIQADGLTIRIIDRRQLIQEANLTSHSIKI